MDVIPNSASFAKSAYHPSNLRHGLALASWRFSCKCLFLRGSHLDTQTQPWSQIGRKAGVDMPPKECPPTGLGVRKAGADISLAPNETAICPPRQDIAYAGR